MLLSAGGRGGGVVGVSANRGEEVGCTVAGSGGGLLGGAGGHPMVRGG